MRPGEEVDVGERGDAAVVPPPPPPQPRSRRSTAPTKGAYCSVKSANSLRAARADGGSAGGGGRGAGGGGGESASIAVGSPAAGVSPPAATPAAPPPPPPPSGSSGSPRAAATRTSTMAEKEGGGAAQRGAGWRGTARPCRASARRPPLSWKGRPAWRRHHRPTVCARAVAAATPLPLRAADRGGGGGGAQSGGACGRGRGTTTMSPPGPGCRATEALAAARNTVGSRSSNGWVASKNARREGAPPRPIALRRASAARISVSMAACRVAGSSRMWRMTAPTSGSTVRVKQAGGRDSRRSCGPAAANTSRARPASAVRRASSWATAAATAPASASGGGGPGREGGAHACRWQRRAMAHRVARSASGGGRRPPGPMEASVEGGGGGGGGGWCGCRRVSRRVGRRLSSRPR